MHPFSTTRPVAMRLAKRELLRLDRRTLQVRCHSGSVWITQDHDTRDIVLEPGDHFIPDPARQAIAYALDAASLTLCIEANAPAPVRARPGRTAGRGLVLE